MTDSEHPDDHDGCGQEHLDTLRGAPAAEPEPDALLDGVRIEVRRGEIVITIRGDALNATALAPAREAHAEPLADAAPVMVPRTRGGPPRARGRGAFVGFGSAPADRYRGGFPQIQLRKDLVESYNAALSHVHVLGGMLTSSGAIRDLREPASAGRSTTSLHYTGRALDLFIYSGMQGGDEPYLVTRAGGSDANPEWELFCVSTAPLTTNPLYDASLIAERDVQCVRWVENVGYRTHTRRATCFSLTKVMARYGWKPIPARGSWRSNYLSCEWWHFQNAAGMIDGVSTFGEQLLEVWPEQLVRASGLALGAVWRGRSFHADGTTPPPPAADETDAAEKVLWAQTVLNAVAGTALSVDGEFGTRSREALRHFQAVNGIPAGGALDATTEIALVQRALERLDGATFARMGVIDEATVKAVSAFQGAHGLKVDGRSGPKTRAAMVEALGGAPRSVPRSRIRSARADGDGASPRRGRGSKRTTRSARAAVPENGNG